MITLRPAFASALEFLYNDSKILVPKLIMPYIFVSYSRKDLKFTQRIVNALATSGLETWVDWKSIPKGEKWLEEIYRGIEAADAFLFLISPDSVNSDYCKREIEHAVKNNKRIIPLVVRDADSNMIPSAISERNWILCRYEADEPESTKDDFDAAIEETSKTIKTDYSWLRYHTSLQVKALEWDNTKDTGRLLRGKELREAEQKIVDTESSKEPPPSPLQLQFILQSKRYETRIRRQVTWGVVSGLALILLFAAVARIQRNIAESSQATAIVEANARSTAQVQVIEQKNIADTRQLAAISQNLSLDKGHTAIISGLLAVEAANRYPELESDKSLRRYLDSKVALPLWGAQFDGYADDVAFGPDNKLAVTSALDGSVRILDPETDTEIVRLDLKLSPFLSDIGFSPDGKWLLVTDCDQWQDGFQGVKVCQNVIARLFGTVSWQEVSRISQNGGGGILYGSFAFSPDSKWVASGGNDGSIRLWDPGTGKQISTLDGYFGANDPVVISPDGKWIVCGGSENTLIVRDAMTGRELSHIAHGDSVTSAAFSLDGTLIASAAYDHTIKVWEVSTGEEIIHIDRGSSSGLALRFTSNGKWIVSKENDNTIRVWDTRTGQEVSKMDDNGGARAFDVSPDGKWIASSLVDMVQVWDAATGHEIARLFHDDWLINVRFSPDGRRILSESSDMRARLWEINAYQDVSLIEHDKEVTSVVFSSDGKWIASGSWDGTTRIWDAVSQQELSRFTVDGLVTAIAFSPDNGWLAQAACEGVSQGIVACGQPVIRVWATNSGQEIQSFESRYKVEALKFLPDGKRILISDSHANIQLIELASGKVVTAFKPDLTGAQGAGASGSLNTFNVQFDVDPSGQLVVAGGLNSVQVWELKSNKELLHLPHEGFSSVAFSPDGKRIVSARNDIQIFDAETGKELNKFLIDLSNGGIGSIGFSPDGKWLAGTSGTGIKVWDLSNGNEFTELRLPQTVSLLAFSPDGKWIASGSYDHLVRLWLWRSGDLVAEVCNRLPRNLTRDEWSQYIGDEPYRQTCPKLPAEPEVPITPTP